MVDVLKHTHYQEQLWISERMVRSSQHTHTHTHTLICVELCVCVYTGLTANEPVLIRIAASTEQGLGPFSDNLTFITMEACKDYRIVLND